MAGPPSTSRLLDRAKGYPYDAPEACFVLACGRVLPLVGIDLTSTLDCEVDDGGTVRTLRAWAQGRGVHTDDLDSPQPLLAYGSNASMEALSRKLAHCVDDAVIPVAKATLAGLRSSTPPTSRPTVPCLRRSSTPPEPGPPCGYW